MDFALTEDQRAFQATARQFARDAMMPQAAHWDEDEIFPVETLREAAALGFGGIYIGEDVGGSGLGRLDAVLIFAPVGSLVPAALRAVRKGGTVVCAGIHMSEIPAFAYEILWGERAIRSVANLTRADGEEFLALAARVPVRTHVEIFDLQRANEALDAVRSGRVHGAAVLRCA